MGILAYLDCTHLVSKGRCKKIFWKLNCLKIVV